VLVHALQACGGGPKDLKKLLAERSDIPFRVAKILLGHPMVAPWELDFPEFAPDFECLTLRDDEGVEWEDFRELRFIQFSEIEMVRTGRSDWDPKFEPTCDLYRCGLVMSESKVGGHSLVLECSRSSGAADRYNPIFLADAVRVASQVSFPDELLGVRVLFPGTVVRRYDGMCFMPSVKFGASTQEFMWVSLDEEYGSNCWVPRLMDDAVAQVHAHRVRLKRSQRGYTSV